MKKILISVRPKWCEKICHVIGKEEAGKPIYEKRIEVRKSAPKEVPFKAYIYETKDKKIECGFHFEDTGITLREKYVFGMHKARIIKHYRNEGRGKVIGEFICDKVDEYTFSHYEAEYRVTHVEQKAMCLNQPELIRYGKGDTLYGWHIADLKIYDKPKELSEFTSTRVCDNYKDLPAYGHIGCNMCKYSYTINCMIKCRIDGRKPLTRPPQSYMRVKELKEV